jgi:hypothetical protein
MPLGIGSPKSFNAIRCETRVPMEVGVHISGHGALPGTETTFTENVSSRGARVVSTRRWKINDRLIVTTLAGSFQTIARVAYCHTVPQVGFAVGLEFVEPREGWVMGDGFGS